MEDETLKRLLAAESQAEQIIAQADRERAALIEQAKKAAQAGQSSRAQRTTEIHASVLAQAQQRAEQTIAEMKRRYAERSEAMKAAAEPRKGQALDAALALVLGAGKGEP